MAADGTVPAAAAKSVAAAQSESAAAAPFAAAALVAGNGPAPPPGVAASSVAAAIPWKSKASGASGTPLKKQKTARAAAGAGGTPIKDNDIGVGEGGSLLCGKCGDEVSQNDSQKAGKNELLRNCYRCCATDKWLSNKATCQGAKRRKAANGSEGVISDHDKELQRQALRIREWMKNPTTSKEDVTNWYKSEKMKREDESAMQRRTLNNPKGVIESSHQEGTLDDAIIGWQTYT